MGILAEFNPDLALRDISEYEKGKRKKEECIPADLKVGKTCSFLKKGQRLFWLSDSVFWKNGQLPLCMTSGDEKLTDPIASIKILEVTHFLDKGEIWTKGLYKVLEVFHDDKIHFNGLKKI